MKKLVYLSIALISLSLVSCREQDEMVQMNGQEKVQAPAAATTPDNNDTYGTFNSSLDQDGDPTRPPKL